MMETITCPSCGRPHEFEEFLFDANEFCECDFPLFWAPGSERIARFEPVEAATARMPGESGVVPHGSRECPDPTGRELNDRRATHCVLCGVNLNPVAPPVAAPPPPPIRQTAVIVPAVPWWVVWKWWLVAGGMALGVGALWLLIASLT